MCIVFIYMKKTIHYLIKRMVKSGILVNELRTIYLILFIFNHALPLNFAFSNCDTYVLFNCQFDINFNEQESL